MSNQFTITAAKCQFCCDTGWTGWAKPMTGKDGRLVMVFVPQRCSCQAGKNFTQQVIIAGDDLAG